MRRIGRWMLNGLTAFSLFLLVFSCVHVAIAIRADRSWLRARTTTTAYVDVGIRIPAAVLIGALAFLPIVWVVHRITLWLGYEHPPGLCKRCSYDLTANVSGVCPECGMMIAEGR
jgi:hypothetical protein